MDVGPAPGAPQLLHPCSDPDVLDTVVAPHSTRAPMLSDCLLEEVKHRLCEIVRARAYASNEARLSVDECVDDNLPANET